MAWLPSIRDKLGAFARLPGHDRLLLIRAWSLLFGVTIRLRLRSLNGIWADCVRRATRHGRPEGDVPPEELERVAWLVNVASRYHPLRPTCLTRTLSVAWLLAGRGVPTQLQIGIRRDARGLAAHAWLAYGGCPITPVPEDEEYHPLEPAG